VVHSATQKLKTLQITKGTKVFGQMVDPRPHEWRQPCPRRKYEMNNTLLAIPVRKDAYQRAGT